MDPRREAIGAIAGAGMLMKGRAEAAQHADQTQYPETRSLGVPEAIKRLAACNDDLASAISALHARIAPVLMPASDATGEALPPVPVRSPLAHEIHSEADRVYGSTCALRELLARLDA